MSDILKQKYSYGDTEFAFQKSFYCSIDSRVREYLHEHTADFVNTDLKSDDLRFYLRALMDPIADLLKNNAVRDIDVVDNIYHAICDGLLTLSKTCKSKRLYAQVCKILITEIPLDFLCFKYDLHTVEDILNTGYKANGETLNAVSRDRAVIRYKNIDAEYVQNALVNLIYLALTNVNIIEELATKEHFRKYGQLYYVLDNISKEINKKTSKLQLNNNLINILISLQIEDSDKLSGSVEIVKQLVKDIIKKYPEHKLNIQLLETFLPNAKTEERFLYLTHATNQSFNKQETHGLPEITIDI